MIRAIVPLLVFCGAIVMFIAGGEIIDNDRKAELCKTLYDKVDDFEKCQDKHFYDILEEVKRVEK